MEPCTPAALRRPGDILTAGMAPSPQPETIATAWRRARMSGLEPGRLPRNGVATQVDPTSSLLAAAQPVLDRLAKILAGTHCCVMLTDRDVRFVDLRYGTSEIDDAVTLNGAVLGRSFSEETSGTNAVATVHELRTPLTVRGDQHFIESMKKFSCYGFPILHPLTHRIEGVLCLTFFVADDNPLLQPMLEQAAHEIETRLLEQSPRNEQALFADFQRACARHRGGPVVAIADDAVLVNATAAALLDSVDFAALATLVGGEDFGDDRPHTLNSGARMTLRWSRTLPGAGLVIELSPSGARSDQVGVLRAPPRSRSQRIHRQVTEARTSRRPLCVVGEPGSGRTTLLRQLMAGADVRAFDAVDLLYQSEPQWLRSVGDALESTDRPVTIENVHLLTPTLARQVFAATQRTSAWFALSSGPLNRLSPEVFQLVDSCHTRLELLPLRLRKHEIPALVDEMLLDMAAQVHFTPAAIKTFLAHNWPGNISELEAEVRAAARAHSVGDITEKDLGRLRERAAAPQLSPLDAVLRATIEDELIRHRGNKLAAARSLNISRTTLYKRIRDFGISD